MAKGASSKEAVTKKILEAFDGSFINEKEIRIPMIEDGELIQIKVVLTAAKTNVDNPNGSGSVATVEKTTNISATEPVEVLTEPTEDEKQRLNSLLDILGLER